MESDRINVSLFGLGSALRALAEQRQMSITALIKSVLLPLLGDVSGDATDHADATAADDFGVARVGVRMTRKHARLWAKRARASGLSQGQYLGALLDGEPPPALHKDHALLILALRNSSDRLAAMSVDLNAFMRLLKQGPVAELQSHQVGLQSLGTEVRAHLVLAATLLAELRHVRRPQ